MKHKVDSFYQGFTLIEVLVVILIMSIVISVTSLSIHVSQKKAMETIAHQILQLITLAEEDAMLQPATLGLIVSSHQLKWVIFDEHTQQWHLYQKKILQLKNLPNYVHLTLSIHHKAIQTGKIPAFIINQNGDFPAFEISIGYVNQPPLYSVIGEENGHLFTKIHA